MRGIVSGLGGGRVCVTASSAILLLLEDASLRHIVAQQIPCCNARGARRLNGVFLRSLMTGNPSKVKEESKRLIA